MATITLAEAVAANVGTAITAAGLNPHSVANGTGIPLSTLNRRLTGNGSGFTVSELGAIAALLGTTPDAFLNAQDA